MNIKLWIRQSILPLLLVGSARAENDVSCTTSEVNLLQNPSFESGSLSGWKNVGNTLTAVSGSDAADGVYYAERSSTYNRYNGVSGLYQTVSGLVEGSTYTVSADFRLRKTTPTGVAPTCSLAFYMVGMRTSYLGGHNGLRATTEDTPWTTASAQFTATASSGTFYVYVICPPGYDYQTKLDLDNIKFLSGETTTSCITSTTLPTSMPPVSLPVPPSTDLISSSTVIPSQVASVKPSTPAAVPTGSSLVTSSGSSTLIPIPSSVSHVSSSTPLVPSLHVTSSSAISQSSSTFSPPSISSSLTRVTISSRPPPSSRPTLRPIGSSSISSAVPSGSSSISVPAGHLPSVTITVPAEIISSTATSTGNNEQSTTTTGSSGSGDGSGHNDGSGSSSGNVPGDGNSGSGNGDHGNGSGPNTGTGNGGSDSGNGDSGNGDSGNGDSGNGDSGNGDSGNGDSGNGDSGNGDSGNGDSGNGDSGSNGEGSLPGSGGSGSEGGSGNNSSTSNGGISPSAGVTTPSPTAPQLTTSTVFATRTSTITACAATVTDCPARSTYVTTETIVVSTTICPVEASTTTNSNGALITGSPAAPGNAGGPQYTTETLLTTRTVTVTACPSTVTNCPAREKTTSVTTETLVAGTTVYEVTPTSAGAVQTPGTIEKPAPGQGGDSNVPGPKVTEIATVNPNQPPVHVVYSTTTQVVTVLACPAKKETLA